MACVFQAVAHEQGHVPGSWDVTMDAGYAEDAPSQGREQTVPHATTTSTAPPLSAANAAAFIAAVRPLFFNAPPGEDDAASSEEIIPLSELSQEHLNHHLEQDPQWMDRRYTKQRCR